MGGGRNGRFFLLSPLGGEGSSNFMLVIIDALGGTGQHRYVSSKGLWRCVAAPILPPKDFDVGGTQGNRNLELSAET
jgi:hypothetical protein